MQDHLLRAERGMERTALESTMSVNTEETLCIPVTLGKVYQEMNLSPVELLRNYALNQIHARIHKYEAERSFFESKHKNSYEAFRDLIESMEGEENFEWEEDLMDWEFAMVNLSYWQGKAREIAIE